MNFAYYRKSKYKKDESVNRVKENLQKHNIKLVNEMQLSEEKTVLLSIYKEDWTKKVINLDRNLIGFLPWSVVIQEKNGETYVGISNPEVLGGVTENSDIQKVSIEVNDLMRKLVDDVTDAGQLKPSHVKLYSTVTCPYCKMEKEWLETNKVEHEVIYVDQNQEEAQKMVQKTGQMGVPVTEVQYEDGESEFIVGFNRPALAKIIGIK